MKRVAVVYDSKEDENWAAEIVEEAGWGSTDVTYYAAEFNDILSQTLKDDASSEVFEFRAVNQFTHDSSIVFLVSKDSPYAPNLSRSDIEKASIVLMSGDKRFAVEQIDDSPIPEFIQTLLGRQMTLWDVTSDSANFKYFPAAPSMVGSDNLKIVFDSELSLEQTKGALTALANYFRACGGIGMPADIETEKAFVRDETYA